MGGLDDGLDVSCVEYAGVFPVCGVGALVSEEGEESFREAHVWGVE